MLQQTTSGSGRPASALTIGFLGSALIVVMSGDASLAGDMPAGAGWLNPALMAWIDEVVVKLSAAVRVGFERQPAAVMAIGGAMAVPLMAISVALTKVASRMALKRGHGSDLLRGAGAEEPQGGSEAWLEVENHREAVLAIGELTRIGRSDDCDLELADASVAHTHALIRRTPDCEFIILDVSADHGAGMAINGKRLRQGTLRDGDRIELGSACMIFRQALMGSSEGMPTAT